MRNYEVTFIVDPVLSKEEIASTAQSYVDKLKELGCTIVFVDEMGLRQLAYTIKKKTSGIYYSVEFSAADGSVIDPVELLMKRDDHILRFLTVSLDKFGVKYNEDKRNGLIGTVKKPEPEPEKPKEDNRRRNKRRGPRNQNQSR